MIVQKSVNDVMTVVIDRADKANTLPGNMLSELITAMGDAGGCAANDDHVMAIKAMIGRAAQL